jgi:acyl-CoA hydrolase
MPTRALTSLDQAIALLRERVPGDVVLAAPLGLGKPHRLLNAIYRHAAADPARRLSILTALSLTPPRPGSDLERRFLAPFLERQFGADFPVLEYVLAQRAGTLPRHIEVEEFYLQSGAMLGKPDAQRRYASLNYTHVARAVAARGCNVLVQMVAREPGGTRLSLSCNPDLTFDLLDEIARIGGTRPLLLAEVHPDLPFLGGGAAVPGDYFDAVLDIPGPAPKLFCLPRQPVADAEFAIGLYASTLVKDGGTLQIGIGALSDALTHALVLRHTRNADYRRLLRALWPEVESSPLVAREGGLAPFLLGLYGASEMVMDGFQHLIQAGVLKRRVVDDIELMRRDAAGSATAEDGERMEREGQVLHGGFWLGSADFVRWLRELPPELEKRIGMTRISHINELYGGNETLERLQRRHPRFFNTCMMMSLLGAATSDALENGQVVSGVGGQYNFVAMAHALHDSRSVLMLRAAREGGGRKASNVVWSHGHVTIPRHLRDVVITEYGIADLRHATDEDCILAMLTVCEAPYVAGLEALARRNGKLRPAAVVVDARNTPSALAARLAPFRREGLLPDYPLGSDFTPVEQRLVRALGWLRGQTATRATKLRTVFAALAAAPGPAHAEFLQRMALATPRTLGERLLARLVTLALNRTA